jgi:hypothetical protein
LAAVCRLLAAVCRELAAGPGLSLIFSIIGAYF